MTQAKTGDTVAVHYTGKLEDGTVFDSSRERGDPIEFEIGAGKIIPGFEQAVIGMSPGESKEEKIPAEQAYGERQEDRVVQVERKDMPENVELKVGQQLQARDDQGNVTRVIVAGLDEAKVTLDANHPLAGKDLYFDIELVKIA